MKGRSSLHPIEGAGTGLRGYVEVALRDGQPLAEPQPKMHLEIPVTKITSGNAFEDQQMQKLLGSRSFPDLVAELREARALDGPGRLAVKGAVSVAGTTQIVDGEIVMRCDGDTLFVGGEQTFDVRKFGIEPPRILMLQVYPEVTVRLSIVASKEG